MQIFRFDKIDSTNNFLKTKKDLNDYDLAIAQSQTAGRGRRGNNWISSDGMALFSFAVKSDKFMPIAELSKIPLITGLATARTLQTKIDIPFLIKWPNDIYVNNKKIAGILVEKVNGFFIIGIGININNHIDSDFLPNAVSLQSISNQNHDIDEIIFNTIDNFKLLYSELLRNNWSLLLNELNSLNYLKNKSISIKINLQETIEGTVLSISDTGQLEIISNNKVLQIDSGEVHIGSQ